MKNKRFRMKGVMMIGLCALLSLVSCKDLPLRMGGGAKKGPHWKDVSLANGMKGIVVEEHSVPIVYYRAVIRSGSAADPKAKSGVANLTGELLLRGTKGKSRDEIFTLLEGIGATLDVSVDYDYLTLGGSVLSKNRQSFLKLLAEILIQPTFPQEELEKLRHEVLGQIEEKLDSDQEVATLHFRRNLFGVHPYSRPVLGTKESVPEITRTDIMNFYRENFVSGNLILEGGGDLSPKETISDFELLFAGVPTGEARTFSYGPVVSETASRVFLIDKPQRTQTQILIGQVGLQANDPDYIPLSVINAAFGGMFTSPLNDEIRVKRGWSYGAQSFFRNWKESGTFALFTFPANKDTIPSIELMLALYRDFIDKGVKESTFSHAKEHLFNSYAFEWETPSKVLSLATRQIVYDLPSDYYQTYAARVKAVQLPDAKALVKKRLRKEPLLFTLVCNARDFYQKAGAFGAVTVRRYDE